MNIRFYLKCDDFNHFADEKNFCNLLSETFHVKHIIRFPAPEFCHVKQSKDTTKKL